MWKRRSRSYIERTGDAFVGRRRCGVVLDDVGVAIGVGNVLFCASGVEVEGRWAFDGTGDGFGGGVDATVAYEGRTGERGRGEEGDDGLGVVFG